jgi:hypothetical protein
MDVSRQIKSARSEQNAELLRRAPEAGMDWEEVGETAQCANVRLIHRVPCHALSRIALDVGLRSKGWSASMELDQAGFQKESKSGDGHGVAHRSTSVRYCRQSNEAGEPTALA